MRAKEKGRREEEEEGERDREGGRTLLGPGEQFPWCTVCMASSHAGGFWSSWHCAAHSSLEPGQPSAPRNEGLGEWEYQHGPRQLPAHPNQEEQSPLSPWSTHFPTYRSAKERETASLRDQQSSR